MLTKSSPQVTAASSMLIGSMPQLITIFQTTWITAHLLIITLSISKRPQFGPRIKSLLIEIPQTTVILSHLRFSSRLESKWSILGTKSPLGIYCVFQREILSKSMKEIATRRILHGSLLDLSVQMQNRHRSHRFPPFFVLGFFTFFLMLRQNVRLEFLCTLYSFGYGSIRPYFNLLLGLGPLYLFKKKKKLQIQNQCCHQHVSIVCVHIFLMALGTNLMLLNFEAVCTEPTCIFLVNLSMPN